MPAETEVREYFFQLHRSGPSWGEKANEADWITTAVGTPVRFEALSYGEGAWRTVGPVAAKAAEALEDAIWTVLAGDGQTFVFMGYVGRPLAEGEEFALPLAIFIGVPHI
jgi:hypothetical protein